MGFITRTVSALLVLHTASSYILLTANLDDVQTLAKQLAHSPVVGQLGKIFRRAATQFNKQYRDQVNTQRRNEDADLRDADDESTNGNEERNEVQGVDDNEEQVEQAERRNDAPAGGDTLVALGKTASIYLKSIKKMFEQL